DHVAFRPIDAKMGPDGALYIADWYNPIIQHGEVDFRDERRDHTHGRIWRVTYRGNPLVDRPHLAESSNEELIAQLASPEAWTRNQAKRLLKERGSDVLPAVKHWLRNLDNTAADYHRLRLEGLWVYQSLDVVEPELLASLLRCVDHNARAAACRVVGDWHARLDDPLALLEPRATDEHPRVRLEAVRALAEIPHPRAVEVAMLALDPDVPSLSKFMPIEIRQANQRVEKRVDVDEWLDYALWLTARDLQPVWEPRLLAGELDFGGNTRHLTFVLKSAGSVAGVPVLVRLLKEGSVAADEREGVLAVISEHGDPNALQELLDLAAASDDGGLQSEFLQSLLQAKRRRNVVPGGAYQSLEHLLRSTDDVVQGAAASCVGAFQVERLWPELKSLAESGSSFRSRKLAIHGLAAFGGPESEAVLTRLLQAGDPFDVEAASALMPLRPEVAAAAVVKLMQERDLSARIDGLLETAVRNAAAVKALTEALDGRSIPSDAAVIALRAVSSSGQSLPELTAALQRAGGINSGPRQLSREEMAALVAEVERQGNPTGGEHVYRRQDLNCVKCHAIGGAGGLVGPDMQSLGTTAQLDYIIDALLDPNKQVKENYHTQVVVTDEGLTVSGILVRQSDRDLILRDAEGREQAVPLDSIELRQEGVSLMPAGLTEKLTRAELVNLVSFLKALGRVPEFTVGTGRVARKWQVLQPTEAAAIRLRRIGDGAIADNDPAFRWQTFFSRVNGVLPLQELRSLTSHDRQLSMARMELESDAADAAVTLHFNSVDGVTAWWNGEPLVLSTATDVRLKQGSNWLTLVIDRQAGNLDALRLELDGAAGVRFAP
ncbi:MAG: HEAT repeat domain-containing protein, partial [Planctomycetaceae bacterium]|nr:HEAT repeat domain-containing protein [Planctomycetaceae bacterium]